ncbi:MAG: OmpA family protein [Bacteroidetes bacterium]|nr:OmpA family protein [Bacteroidota bacterium]
MAALPKVVLILILWFLYSLFVYKGCYPCLSEAFCGGCGVETAATTGDVAPPVDIDESTVSKRFPIDFEWGNANPFTNEGFKSLNDRILASSDNTNILEITGWYFDEEGNTTDQENIGLARAKMLRDLIAPDIPDDRIRLRARKVNEKEGVREGYFESAGFEWGAAEAAAVETVEEIDDLALIRFPYGSVQKERDPAFDKYLDDLATRVKQTGENVFLTGHTDGRGSEESNLSLGDRRAKVIRDILVSKGVNSSLITTQSKGESEPVASNETDEGRQENRRVEVRLIKQ